MEINPNWFAAGAATVASLIGLANLWITLKSKKDKILVRGKHFMPRETNTDGLYVINLSEHVVEINDYGFILGNGLLFSLPRSNAFGSYDGSSSLYSEREPYFEGSRLLKPREIMQCGRMMYSMDVIGAFAITAAQNTYTRHFDASWYIRITPKYIWARLRSKFFVEFDHNY